MFNRPLDKVKVTDFFGNVQNVELTKSRYPLLQDETVDEEPIHLVTNNSLPAKYHLFHSFLVEKNSKSSTVFGAISALVIGYVISATVTM